MKDIKMKRTFFGKLTALFLTPCMLLSMFICTALAEAETESTNLVRNGDFENSTTMKADWEDLEVGVVTEWKADDSTYATVEVTDEMASSNEGDGYAVKLTNTKKNAELYARQNVLSTHGIIPGVTYRFSYRIYIEDTLGERNDAGVGAFLTSYPSDKMGNGTHLQTSQILYPESSTNGRWNLVSDTFVFPSEATSLRILMRCHAEGTVYFDDISLEKIGEPDKFEFYASHVFHYNDEKQGTVNVNILPYYQTGENKLDEKLIYANFGIYDGENRLTGQDNVTFTNFQASYTYPVSALLTEKTQYTLRVSVLDDKNVELDSYTQSLYRYPRPNFLDENGNFRDRFGKIVSPFNAWHLNQSHFEKASEAGFTTFTMVYDCRKPENEEYTRQYLTAAEDAGLIGLFTLYDEEMNAAAHPTNIDNTKSIVDIFKNDKRFLGWVIQDEPLGGGKDPEETKKYLELSYKTIRDKDPNHPIILTDYNKVVFKDTIKYCDIFIPNAYSGGANGVRSYVEEAAKYAYGKPIYPNVKAYAKSLDKLPSGEEVKHQIHQAFWGGAKGVSVYAFSDSVNNGEKGSSQIIIPIFNTPIWDSLVETGTKEIPVLFDLFVYGKEEPDKSQTATYVQRKWTRDDGDYYFLLSTSNAGATVEYDIGAGKDVTFFSGESASDYTFADGKLSVTLKVNTLEDGKTQCYDVLLFKVFNATAIRVEKNGTVISKTEAGELYITAPEETNLLLTCLMNESADKTVELIRIGVAKGNEMNFLIDEAEEKYSVKIYAWDSNLRPVVSAQYLPPNPRS